MLAGPNSIMIVHTLPLPLRESDTGCDSGHRRSIAFVQLWEVLKLKNPRNEKEAGVFSPSALFLYALLSFVPRIPRSMEVCQPFPTFTMLHLRS